jgi:hypothetical protein
MNDLNQRDSILKTLIGKWQSVNGADKITITFTEHISVTGDGFSLIDCKKSVQNSNEETFRLNFFWTNNVLRVYYAEKQCVVCFIENKMNLGFFKSILTCNEIKDSDQIIRFKKT